MTTPSRGILQPRRPPRPNEEFDVGRPFTTTEAVAAGLPRRVLSTSRFRRLLHGVYVAADVEVTDRLRAAAALAWAPPTAWASHASAARVRGVPLPALAGEHISVLSAAERVRIAGVTSHVGSPASRITRVAGLRISAPAQMFVELAEQLGLVDLVVVGDWLVRQEYLSLGELGDFCAASRLRGARHARRAAAYVRERVDSPMETRLRLLIVMAGLPEPDVNLEFTISGRLRRIDLAWPAVKVAVEYDGRHHVTLESQWEDDLDRRDDIADDGWRMVVVSARGIFRRPDLTLGRIERALRKAGARAVPPRLDDTWRQHFPVQAASW